MEGAVGKVGVAGKVDAEGKVDPEGKVDTEGKVDAAGQVGKVGNKDRVDQKRVQKEDSDWPPYVVHVDKMAYIENEEMVVDQLEYQAGRQVTY